MSNNIYCVIMAGGVGRRFWPLSTTQTPKQFLDILGTGKTLIQQTFDRFRPLCPLSNILVVTNKDHKALVLEQLPELEEEQVLAEPLRRSTASCIAYANAVIKKKNPDAKIIVTPSDHLILDEATFRIKVDNGLNFIEGKDILLTLGIKPSRPETAYGYLQAVEQEGLPSGFNKVKTFTEKPDLEMARVLLESGEFFWNSGIFIWSLKSIEKAFHKHLREIATLFDDLMPSLGTVNHEKALYDTYLDSRKISIDYGVMEKANNVFVQIVDCGWSDLGTWTSLHDSAKCNSENNAVLSGQVLMYNTEDSIVHLPKGKSGVIQGLKNFIVVQSDNSLLICPKDNEQQIRQFTADLKAEFGGD